MKLFMTRRTLVIATFVLFIAGIWSGWTLWDTKSPQWEDYEQGLTAYNSPWYDQAVEYFDRSFSDYQAQLAAPSLFAPPASLELAELSEHLKALALIKEGTASSAKLAVKAFKEALILTSDYALSQSHLDPATLDKIRQDRKNTQIDLEILYRHRPYLAQAEGKGAGEGDGEKQSEDPSGNNAGKGDRDHL